MYARPEEQEKSKKILSLYWQGARGSAALHQVEEEGMEKAASPSQK